MRHLFSSILILSALISFSATAADPAATSFDVSQCRGTYALYPADVAPAAVPDSLTPVAISHLGRHGSRYPASSKSIDRLSEALEQASEAGSLTETGRRAVALIKQVRAKVAGQWGALDSIGMAEERAIASAMVKSYPSLFKGTRVEAISSFAPRCIMSMYAFTHQIARLNNTVEMTTASGREYSYLLRPFDADAEYREYRQSDGWQDVLEAFCRTDVPLAPLERAIGDLGSYSDEDARELALDYYKLVAGCAASGVPCNSSHFFTTEEYNALWQAENLRMYLLYSSNTVSTIPADMTSPLLTDIVAGLQAVADGNPDAAPVVLRFAHAETLMPLLGLLKLKGCYYMTNYFDTVATHWQDFNITPMAANVQFVLFKSKRGRLYLKVMLNGRALPLLPGSEDIYVAWETARGYMERCVPIFYQP